MSTLRDRGQAALNRRMGLTSGVTITYARGTESVTIAPAADGTGGAWVGRTLFARQTEDPGPTVVWGERDYLIPVAALVIAGGPTTPQRGDRVTETVGGVDVVFELQTPTGEPEWRFADQTRTLYRVHVRRVG